MKKAILIISILVILTCLTLTTFTAEDVFEEGSTGKWEWGKVISPIDDTATIWFGLRCEDTVNSRSPVLWLRWVNGKTGLYISWNNYLSDNTSVTYRLDAEKAAKKTWNGSTNNETTFYPGKSETVIKFIQKLMKANKLAVQVTPYGEGPTTAVFDIRGLKNVVEQFNDTLGWIEERE